MKGKRILYEGRLLNIVNVHNGRYTCEDDIGSTLYRVFIWDFNYKIFDKDTGVQQ